MIHYKNHDTVTIQQALDTILPVVNQNLDELGVKLDDINNLIGIINRERENTRRIYEDIVENKADAYSTKRG